MGKVSFQDFINKARTFEIGDYTFKEPSVKKTQDLKVFYDKAMKEEIDEIAFFVGFLQELLIKGESEQLKKDIDEMPLNEVANFFFYILKELGLNFTKTLSQK